MNRKKYDPYKKDDSWLKRLLSTAAADPEELPGWSPFFMTRVRQRIATSSPQGTGASLGEVAWRMLPAMLTFMLLLCAWTGYENYQVSRAREEAITRMLSPRGNWTDAVGIMLLTEGSPGGTEN